MFRACTGRGGGQSSYCAPPAAGGPVRPQSRRILAGKGKQEDFQLLLDLSENMTGKTICVLSDSCAAPIVSGIQKFRPEFEAYIAGAREPALATA